MRVAEWATWCRVFLLASLMLLAVPSAVVAQAPDGADNPQSAIRNPQFMVSAGGKKMAAFDGKATPLFWADGVTQVAQLDEYKRTGLNTVIVRLRWQASPDGELVPVGLDAPRALAAAAAAKGLHIIYSLPPAPSGMEASFRMAADSNAYFLAWATWTGATVAALRDTPNLAGWMLPDDPRSLPFASDAGFSRWLRANYAEVGVINQQWKTGFATVEEITLDAAAGVVSAWQDLLPFSGDMSAEDMRLRIEESQQRANRRPDDRNFAFHPTALALAHYKWDTYRALLDAWAGVVREADPGHLIVSGRLPDYAQLLSLPSSIDVSVPSVQPGMAEADAITHNPQAVDIARRGGRFAAIPVLSTAGSTAVAPDALSDLMPAWADAALAHGASGLAFDSWPDIRQNPDLQRAVATTLTRLQSPAFTALWNQAPVATTAVVLTPLADGHTLQIGPAGQLGQARGLYGFAENLVNGEPSNLVYDLRWGTAFGSVDYLSPDEIGDETDQMLARYAVLVLPQALSIVEPMAQALTRYVAGGGIVVADLGAGAAQAEGQVVGLTPTLSALFGVASPMELKAFTFNLQSMAPHPVLPTWQGITSGRSGVTLTAGDGPGSTAFSGPLGFQVLLPGTVPIALAREIPQRLGDARRGNVVTRLQRAQMTIKPLGTGSAIFAPFRLWNFWRPGHLGFDAFHGDLFSRGAAAVQLGVPSVVPRPAIIPPAGETLYPEMVNYAQSVALLNHNSGPYDDPAEAAAGSAAGLAPGDAAGAQFASVQTAGVGDFLWRGAVCAFLTAQDAPIAPGRRAPIARPDEFESRPHLVSLHATVKPQEMAVATLVPIRAQNRAGGPLLAQIADYGPEKVRLTIWPNATGVMPEADQYRVAVAEPSPVRLTLYDAEGAGNYRVPPASRHRVTVTDLVAGLNTTTDKQARPASITRILMADALGHLQIEFTGAASVVEISGVK